MLGERSCKFHNTLAMNPIIGQYVIYVVQIAYAVYAKICNGVLIEKVPCICLVGLLWVTYTSANVLLGSFLCMLGIVLKGEQNRPKHTIPKYTMYIVLIVYAVLTLILCKGLKLMLKNEIFN